MIKKYYIEPQTLREKEMFVKGSFLGDGPSEIYNYNKRIESCSHIIGLDINLEEKLKKICKDVRADVNFKNIDKKESSHMYRITSSRMKKISINFSILITFTLMENKKRVPEKL